MSNYVINISEGNISKIGSLWWKMTILTFGMLVYEHDMT